MKFGLALFAKTSGLEEFVIAVHDEDSAFSDGQNASSCSSVPADDYLSGVSAALSLNLSRSSGRNTNDC
jgi:hypothetical protein